MPHSGVTALTQKIVAHGAPQWLVKKIDSTLRGNVGAEVAAMLQACKASAAIIAPAFPAAGRITRNGQCFVHERLLTDTEFASDPKTPVTSADIGMLLAAHSRAEIRYLHAADVAAALANASVSAPLLLVVDAQSDAELDEIVARAESAASRPLLVGVRRVVRCAGASAEPVCSAHGTGGGGVNERNRSTTAGVGGKASPRGAGVY